MSPATSSETTPLKVLILCTGNSARGIIGEYLLRAKGNGRFEVYSAGATPSGKVNPLTIWVLRERFGIDASEARSKSWEEVKHLQFDCVITVSDQAKDTCPPWPGKPILAHWGMRDPAAVEGTMEQRERAFVDVAVQLSRRIDLMCALPPHDFDEFRIREIGTDSSEEKMHEQSHS